MIVLSIGDKAVSKHEKSTQKRNSKSALCQHQEETGHTVTSKPLIQNIEIGEKETRDRHRKILEAIHITTSGATLKRNDGAELPDLYLPLLREEGEGVREARTDQLHTCMGRYAVISIL